MKGIALGVALLALIAAEVSTGSPERTLTVKLRNGTAGGVVGARIPVRLETFRGEQKVSEQTVSTSHHGEVLFFGLSDEPNVSFQARVDYAAVPYVTEVISYLPEETHKTVELTVYETTDEPQDLMVSVAHLFFKADEEGVTVQEMLLINNQGDRNYIGTPAAAGAGRQTLVFSLPRDAYDIRIGTGLMSCCILVRETVIVDSMEMPPGSKEVSFSYRLPSRLTTLEWERPVDLPIAQVVLVAEHAQLESMTARLAPMTAHAGTATDGDPVSTTLSGRDLRPGEVLKARVVRLPGSLASRLRLALGFLTAAALGMVAFAALRSYRRRHVSRTSPSPDELAEQIAELDRQFEAGEMAPSTYESHRARLKADLVRLLENEGP
ncbi:MAG: hypothetical protein ACE5JI_09800 [Acidobacteriota bacterium]